MNDVVDDDSGDNVTESTVRMIVRGRCTPELEEELVELALCLSKVNFRGHLEELDVLYQRIDSQVIDQAEIVPYVDQILRMGAATALNTCGVEFDVDIPLAMLIEAAEVLLAFDPTEFPDTVIQHLDGAEDETEAVCGLLDLLGTYSNDDWFAQVIGVSEGFSKRVREVCRRSIEESDSPTSTSGPSAVLLKRLSHLVKSNADSLGASIGRDGGVMGLSLESLYAQYVGRLVDQPIDKAVEDLFSLSVISNESLVSAMTNVPMWLDDLYVDPDQRRIAEQHRIKLAPQFKTIFEVE